MSGRVAEMPSGERGRVTNLALLGHANDSMLSGIPTQYQQQRGHVSNYYPIIKIDEEINFV